MDWVPTLLAAAGARPTGLTRPTAIDCAGAAGAPPHPRKFIWRYKAGAQRAVRDGD